MPESGEQSPSLEGGGGGPTTPTTDPSRTSRKKSLKGGLGTRSQGIHLLALVLKWMRVAGILLAIWTVGYFGFSVSWVLIAELVFVVYGVYKRKKKMKTTAAMRSAKVDEETEEPMSARVDELPTWVYFPDSERAEWLNKVIQQMWPYIGEFVEKILKNSVEPLINKSLPTKLTPFKFEKINLGNIPLRVGGVKVYTDAVKRDEIILDVDVTLASDAEVTISIRNITAGVKDIMVQGAVRIVMRPLVNKMPIIGGLSIFFLNQPNIDFDLTDVANVLDMPLLSTALRTIISDQIANFLVLPNKIPIQLIENARETQMQLLLPQGVIFFTVIEASELKKSDIGVLGKGKSDPYCKIIFSGQAFSTNVIKNCLAPRWNKSFEVIVEDSGSQVINFEVMDKDDPGPDDDLGSTYLSLDDLPERGVVDQWLRLENVKTGQLHVRATWLHLSRDPLDIQKAMALKKKSEMESTAILVVHIDSAKDLPSSRKHLKEPCPFVRVELGNREERTNVKNATTNPKWEVTYQFLVTDPEVQELIIEVLDSRDNDKKLGDRKIRLSTLVASDDMVVSRPFSLKNASRECSIVITLALRILSVEKPSADDDGSEDDVPDEVPTKDEPKDAGAKTESSSVVGVADRGLPSDRGEIRSDSVASNNLEKPEASGMRFRGLQVQSGGKFGRMKLTIRYSSQRQRLVAVIHQCAGLIPCDSDNLADPYVRLYLLPDRSSTTKRKTQTKKDELCPIFDETFEWALSKPEASNRTLELMVKNSVGPFSKKRVNMGLLRLNLFEIDDLSKTVTDWFDLQDPDTAEKSSNPSLHRI